MLGGDREGCSAGIGRDAQREVTNWTQKYLVPKDPNPKSESYDNGLKNGGQKDQTSLKN